MVNDHEHRFRVDGNGAGSSEEPDPTLVDCGLICSKHVRNGGPTAKADQPLT